MVLPGFTTPEEVCVPALMELLEGTPKRHQTETDDGRKSRCRTSIVAANLQKRLTSGRAMATATSALVNPHCGGGAPAPRCSYER